MLPSPTKLRNVSGMKLLSVSCPGSARSIGSGLDLQYQRDQHYPGGNHQEPEY